MHTVVSTIVKLFAEKGHSLYGGEEVTQQQHALQCATMAHNELAPPALVTAALLHDLGHLLHDLPENAPDQGIDDLHENLAAQYLAAHFPDEVTQPIKYHVAAKRYLCATNPVYMGMLSPLSLQSLHLQGGPMTAQEVLDFERNPFCRDAIRLRTWDDNAKDLKMKTPPINFFFPIMEACLIEDVVVS